MKNLQAKNGQTVEVVVDTKNSIATLNGRVIAGVRDNKVKLWNCDLLTDASNKLVVEEMTKQCCKKVEESNKKRK